MHKSRPSLGLVLPILPLAAFANGKLHATETAVLLSDLGQIALFGQDFFSVQKARSGVISASHKTLLVARTTTHSYPNPPRTANYLPTLGGVFQ